MFRVVSMTVRREVSLAFQTNKPPAAYAALAQTTEAYGFDALTVYGDLLFQPPIGPLLLMAQATSRIRLGAAGYNPYTLHPVEIAGQVAMLDTVSGGRAYWGILRGAWLDSIGIEQRKPVQTVREAIGVVQHLLAGKRERFDGDVFRLDERHALQYEIARAHVPLLIGAWGPSLAAVVGELANEIKIGGSANPDVIPVIRERVAVGAALAGRDVDDVGIVIGAVSVVDEDGDAARRKAKREVALYLPVCAALDPTVQIDPELLDRVQGAIDRGEAAAAAALISDDLLARFAFAGTPADLIAHAEALFAAGASRVEFGTPHGLTDADGVRLLGEKVLPVLRARSV